MSVVVTPDARSPVLDAFDIVSIVSDPQESVAVWRDTDADALVVDSIDTALLDEIRGVDDGPSAPVVLVTREDYPRGPADAVLAPDADAPGARAVISRANDARAYRAAVTALFEACRGRDAGHHGSEVRRLRTRADEAYQALETVPPSVLYTPTDPEQ